MRYINISTREPLWVVTHTAWESTKCIVHYQRPFYLSLALIIDKRMEKSCHLGIFNFSGPSEAVETRVDNDQMTGI